MIVNILKKDCEEMEKIRLILIGIMKRNNLRSIIFKSNGKFLIKENIEVKK